MLSFEEIEDRFPEGASSDGATGGTIVSAQWLHDFAKNVSTAEREACARIADGYVGADPIADAIRMRSNG